MNTCLGSSNKFEDLFVPAIVFLAEPRLAPLTQKVALAVVAGTVAGIAVVAVVGTAAVVVAAVAGIAAVVVGIAAAAEAGTESGTEIVVAVAAGIVEQEVGVHFPC